MVILALEGLVMWWILNIRYYKRKLAPTKLFKQYAYLPSSHACSHNRKPTWSEKKSDGRWRSFDYEKLINRDKASLDIFWLKDESLEDSDNLPEPDIIAREIVEDLEAALQQFSEIAEDLGEKEEL